MKNDKQIENVISGSSEIPTISSTSWTLPNGEEANVIIETIDNALAIRIRAFLLNVKPRPWIYLIKNGQNPLIKISVANEFGMKLKQQEIDKLKDLVKAVV